MAGRRRRQKLVEPPAPDQARVGQILSRLPTMSNLESRQLWINALERISRFPTWSLPTRPLLDAIEAEWLGRARQQPGHPDWFRWPSTNVAQSIGGVLTIDWHPEGVLSFFGYRVGVNNGRPTALRRAILDRVFLVRIPSVFEVSYLAEWSEPESAPRLKKWLNLFLPLRAMRDPAVPHIAMPFSIGRRT